jgi:hypothetical protein
MTKGRLKIHKRLYVIFYFLIIVTSIIVSEDVFLEISNFDIGKRAFHIDLGRNYAIVADYDGKVSFIDVFTLEKTEFTDSVIPMGGVYDGEFFYVIDNYKREVLKIKGNTIVRKLLLEAKPVNIKLINNDLYVVTTDPYKFYLIDRNMFIKKSVELPVHSPLIRNVGTQVFIPLFENYKNNVRLTELLFMIPNQNSYIINYNNITYPIDLVGYQGIIYFVTYFEGNLYKNEFKNQPKVAQFGKYTTEIELYRNYIVGSSLMGGVYYYDLTSNQTTVVLDEIPISDIAVSPDNEYLYAVSHIENKLYVIKDKEVYQELDTKKYPIDVEAPDNNIVLVLCTDSEELMVIRRFE